MKPPISKLRCQAAICALELESDWHSVAKEVCLEGKQEEAPKVLKHLDEEVPVQADVGGQVLD